jgi:hypothetical protein
MFSFLNIRPEELLRPRLLSEAPRQGPPRATNSDSPQLNSDLIDGKINHSPGIEINTNPGLVLDQSAELRNSPPIAQSNSSPGLASITDPGKEAVISPGIDITSRPGLNMNTRPRLSITSRPGLEVKEDIIEKGTCGRIDDRQAVIYDPSSVLNSRPGLGLASIGKSAFDRQISLPPNIAITEGSSEQLNTSPGPELTSQDAPRSLLVTQVRYTVRRAKLVQHGHTSNEQKLYEYLWAHATPYDDVSRRVSIGFRTLAEKVRMARASAQKNLRALVQKLALEVIEDFDVTSSKAPTYRVFNYPEILKHREMAGMVWYVRRTQAVRFVDANGQEIIPRVSNLGIELSTNPGLGFNHQPGLILKPPPGLNIDPLPGPELGPPVIEKETKRISNEITSSSPVELFGRLQELIRSFDDEAVETLWTECRLRVADCTVDEILYFANDKAAICRSGSIKNPTGFLLTAVPKCFEGQNFANFREDKRRREETQRQESEARDKIRKRQAEAYRRAEDRLQSLSPHEYETRSAKIQTQLFRDHPNLQWTKQQVNESVRRKLLRELEEEEFLKL